MYLRANPGMDGRLIESALDRVHLERFYGNIRRLLAVWFEGAETDDVTEFITEYVFSSGSWGTMEHTLYAREVMKVRGAGAVRNRRGRPCVKCCFRR